MCSRSPVALTGQAFAGTLYVTPAGSDANSGTLAAPLATPGKALALAAAGDTIPLRAGTYTITRTLSITQVGLTLRSYPGERARIVAGTGDLTAVTSVAVWYASRVTIEDLELQGASDYGIKLDDLHGPQSGISVRRVHIHHTGRDGIKAQNADGLLIENCEIASTGVRDPGNAEGIDVMGSIGATVRRNYVHDIATTGIFVKAVLCRPSSRPTVWSEPATRASCSGRRAPRSTCATGLSTRPSTPSRATTSSSTRRWRASD